MAWIKVNTPNITEAIYDSEPGLFYGNTSLQLFLGLKKPYSVSDIINQGVLVLKNKKEDINFSTGLTGIAPVLDFLSYHNTGYHMDGILQEVDALLYHTLGYSPALIDKTFNIEITFYLYYRLSCTPLSTQQRELWLIIFAQIIERILNMSFPETSIDPFFSIRYNPGLVLVCFYLGLVCGLDRNVMLKRFNIFRPYIMDINPCSPSNRLYIYLVLKNIQNKLAIHDINFDRHLNLLCSSIVIHDIKNELKNRIYVQDGICGLYILCHFLDNDNYFRSKLADIIPDIMAKSPELKRLNHIHSYRQNHLGLLNGIGGLLLTEMLFKTCNSHHGKKS